MAEIIHVLKTRLHQAIEFRLNQAIWQSDTFLLFFVWYINFASDFITINKQDHDRRKLFPSLLNLKFLFHKSKTESVTKKKLLLSAQLVDDKISRRINNGVHIQMQKLIFEWKCRKKFHWLVFQKFTKLFTWAFSWIWFGS